ncbi:MAG: hypothetical protein U9O24_05580 [Campylobacterota bacterium]|nr:hypothetical protein [Campylobacterota bacterium]
MSTSINYNQIIKDCLWEYTMSKDEISDLANSSDFREQQFLFAKILENSTQLFNSMEIFDKDSLERLIVAYRVPTFNRDYMARRKNMLEYYFLDKPLTVNELKWIA